MRAHSVTEGWVPLMIADSLPRFSTSCVMGGNRIGTATGVRNAEMLCSFVPSWRESQTHKQTVLILKSTCRNGSVHKVPCEHRSEKG